jgi:hypothetical protein
VVDLNVPVRATGTSRGVARLVRFDCSGETCLRSEGPPVVYPPPAAPTFTTTTTVIGGASTAPDRLNGQVVGHDVFRPAKVNRDTGDRTTDYLDPDFMVVRVQLAYHDRLGRTKGRTQTYPLILEDGVSLRNRTTFVG